MGTVQLALSLALLAAPGWLGVSVSDLVGGETEEQGVLVEEVVGGSPAEEAGILVGDRIITFGDSTVEDFRSLGLAIRETEPGTKKTVVLLREGEEKDVIVVVGKRPEGATSELEVLPPPLPFALGEVFAAKRRRGFLGVHVMELTPGLRGYFGVEEGGLLVQTVEADTPAERAGLQAGDIILEFHGERMTKPEDLSRVLRKLEEGTPVTIVVLRDKKRMEFDATLEERDADIFTWRTDPSQGLSQLYRLLGKEPAEAEEQWKDALKIYEESLRKHIQDPERYQKMAESLREMAERYAKQAEELAKRQAQATQSKEDLLKSLQEQQRRNLTLEQKVEELERKLRELEKRLEQSE